MIDLIKDYAEKKIELVKLDATEKSLKIIGVSVPVMIISVLAIFFIFLLNVSLGLFLGNWLHNFAYGFLILAAKRANTKTTINKIGRLSKTLHFI
jgi:hypothetical protein